MQSTASTISGPRACLAGLAGLAIIGLTCSAAHAQSTDDPWQLCFLQVTKDIEVAYRPEPLRFLVEGNVTIIFDSTDVVVVDGSGAPRAARQVIAHIKRRTRHPVSVLVNTHGHGDHTLGNQEYVRAFPGVEIVARPETRAYMTGDGIDYVRQIAASTESRKQSGAREIARIQSEGAPGHEAVVAVLRQYYEHDIDVRQREYRSVQITPPTLTFESRLVLHRDKRDIEVRYLGPGDTHGDAIVYLPRDRVVCTGDMLVHPMPYGFSRDPLEWSATLDSLATLDFDRMIPGHGDVLNERTYLDSVRDLLRDVQAQVARGLEGGLDRDAVIGQVNLEPWRDRFAGDDPVRRYFFGEYFMKPNVERTCDEMNARRGNGGAEDPAKGP